MAYEPANTSTNYDPNTTYTTPVGRLPILGKARAAIDKLRAEIEVARAGQLDSNSKITSELIALESQMIDGSRKTSQDIAASMYEVDNSTKKSASEAGLLNQKTATELAQTSNIIPIDVGHNYDGLPREIFNESTDTRTGVIGNQRALFKKQTDGFDRDAEQKMAKIMVDTYSVRQTTDNTSDPIDAGVDDLEINKVLDKAKSGIKVPII